jgi:hypothetical protein
MPSKNKNNNDNNNNDNNNNDNNNNDNKETTIAQLLKRLFHFSQRPPCISCPRPRGRSGSYSSDKSFGCADAGRVRRRRDITGRVGRRMHGCMLLDLGCTGCTGEEEQKQHEGGGERGRGSITPRARTPRTMVELPIGSGRRGGKEWCDACRPLPATPASPEAPPRKKDGNSPKKDGNGVQSRRAGRIYTKRCTHCEGYVDGRHSSGERGEECTACRHRLSRPARYRYRPGVCYVCDVRGTEDVTGVCEECMFSIFVLCLTGH